MSWPALTSAFPVLSQIDITRGKCYYFIDIEAGDAAYSRTSWAESRKRQTENRLSMEIQPLDFFLGLTLGGALGVGATLLVIRIRGWLGRSEAGRLRSENTALKRRLAEKDRHIGKMLDETQRLAERLGQKNVKKIKEIS
jgi:hypothetical protein